MSNKINEYEYKLLSKEEERTYLLKIQNGDEKAKNEFILKNKGLVYSIAKIYCSNEVPIDDLYHQGIIGLLTAIDKFDLSLNYKFSTYATWWIRQEIRNYSLHNKRLLYFSNHYIEKIEKYNKIIPILAAKYCRMPNDEEIKKELNWDDQTLRKVRLYNSECLSLNQEVSDSNNEETEGELIDFIKPEYNLQDEVEENMLKTDISDAILNAGLNNIEKEIIKLKYYNEEYINATNETIANHLSKKLTGERVRTLEIRALRKIKNYIMRNKIELKREQGISKLSKKEKIKLFKDETFFLYVMEEKNSSIFPDGTLAFSWFKYHFNRDNKKTYVDEDAIEVLQLCKKYKDKYPVIKDKII